jgi:hypothetical protein
MSPRATGSESRLQAVRFLLIGGLALACLCRGATGSDYPSGKASTNHWAFRAPVRPPVPQVNETDWVRTPVDNFVLARLEKEKLKPSAEADPVTLLRRLSLDLVGLPPSIEEVDAFLADASNEPYRQQGERLLASPHYGERWGRHWLDAARYADSDGFEKDKSREVWFYRDWVIKAFNEDMPYDRFIIEQIGGDQFPSASQDQVVATGFLRHSMLNEEGAIDPEQFRMEGMFDRMDAIGKSVLGLTIQCAQCHNHKFDPLSQEEYYRLFAFINNDYEARPAVYLPNELGKIRSIESAIANIQSRLKTEHLDWQKQMAIWEEKILSAETNWTVLDPEEFGDPGGGARYYKLKDNSILCQGYAPTKLGTRFRAKTTLTNITALRLEALREPNLPLGGPGRNFKGTFALTELKAEAAPLGALTNKTKFNFRDAVADYSQPESPLEKNFYDKSTNNRVIGPIKWAIDGNNDTAWAIDAGPGRRNVDRQAIFYLATNISFVDGAMLTVTLVQNHGGWNSDDHQNNLIGRCRISVSGVEGQSGFVMTPAAVRDILAIPAGKRTAQQQATVFSHWSTTVPEFAEANKQIDELMQGWPMEKSQLVLMTREEPRQTSVLRRGDFLKPIKSVTAGVPTFLHPLPKDADDSRLTFGKWLGDKKSPTTARVFVNRIWQAYFGLGLVTSPEDFGLQSRPPSHPELLDWLACEFMDSGWSVKHVHRLILNSATYRQSSKVSHELYSRDPQNTLLARGPRVRVEGEIVRDIALAASGLLNPTVGGPSLFHPIPFKLEPPLSYAPFPWEEETGADRYRRALYTFRRRSTPYPVLQNFDVPNADFSCVKRTRANTPLQALTTLNETLFVECAQSLARNTLKNGGSTDEDRVTYAFRRALARKPSGDEQQELIALVDKQRKRLADGWLNPNLIAAGANEPARDLPEGATPTQLAAYTVLSRVLLNLDETITKE